MANRELRLKLARRADFSDVFMMDTWWNEATEAQAIDRVHRLGQSKPVFVTRFIIRGTIGEYQHESREDRAS